ncbi:cystathionine beta-lyase [Pusillimonas sp. NJUB218]|uniref:cystathionine beta-lyase n=1 Tax=Pusillimonas sp. NJUB218 TaxID=2023230 RepID=UPI000F4C7FED|nr:cystathionine beta-lyase [Pusillimonas sp. NJUB218]ROT44141.1 cystathionine beta-lyase [Pusillimonas sp. NJUB218]
MSASKNHHLDTLLMHTGMAPFDPATGAAPVALPSVRTSTVRFESLDALAKARATQLAGDRGVTYGRIGMQTHEALESVVCALESAERCFLAPSGLSAMTLSVMALLGAGDHMLVSDSVYGPMRYLDKTVLKRMNIDVTYSRATVADLEPLLRPETRVLYVESPGSLLFEMLDIPALAKFAQQHDLLLVTDNTWGSGYLYRPLELGAHVSVMAGTKYIGGHSDLMLGAVAANDADVIARLNQTHYAMGYSISADDAWLALRGVRTLPIRLRQHAQNALQVCQYLAGRDDVVNIFHPAWPGDPGHALWQRDCHGSNGMMAVELKLTPTQAETFVNALTLFGIGFSWGGYESLVQLVEPGAIAVHSYWSKSENAIVRLHIGLEDPADLIADIQQALAVAGK